MEPVTNYRGEEVQKKSVFGNLFGGFKRPLKDVFTKKVEGRIQDLKTAPNYIPPLVYEDDFEFGRDYLGMNIVITGATGTIGSKLVSAFVQNFLPG